MSRASCRQVLLAVAALLVGLIACTSDVGAPDPSAKRAQSFVGVTSGCSRTGQSPAAAEGEILGEIFQGGVRTCRRYNIELLPDAATSTLLHGYAGALTTDSAYVFDFEYWDPASDEAPCGPLASYNVSGAPGNEVHRPIPVPSRKEAHCVRPGRYELSLAGLTVPLDYLAAEATNVLDNGVSVAVERGSMNAGVSTFNDLNFQVNFGGGGQWSTTAVLRIDSAGALLPGPAFNPPASGHPAGTSSTWFRFAAYGSSTTWSAGRGPHLLSRLYFTMVLPDGTVAWRDSTSYFTADAAGGGPKILRVKQFPEPLADSALVIVELRAVQPDSVPFISSGTRVGAKALDTLVVRGRPCQWQTINKVFVTVGDTSSYSGPGCFGRTAVITQGTGRAYFNAACTQGTLANNPSNAFVVYGCALAPGGLMGTATMRIYRDATLSVLERTVDLKVIQP